MIKEPFEVEEVELGDILLRINHFKDPYLHNEYWLRIGGCCGLKMEEKQWAELCQLVDDYNEETRRIYRMDTKGFWAKVKGGFKK